MRILPLSFIFLLIISSCKGVKLVNSYHNKIQECIEFKIAEKNDAYGLQSYSRKEGGFKRILIEFEESLIRSKQLTGKKKRDYLKLILNIEKLSFGEAMQSEKLNHIQESLGLFTVTYTQTCPAIVLNESLNHRKLILYKNMLDRLPREFEMGIPNEKYLEEFIGFVNFENEESRLFYMYLIFLNLKYSIN
jgi:hypothetical protein